MQNAFYEKPGISGSFLSMERTLFSFLTTDAAPSVVTETRYFKLMGFPGQWKTH